MSREYKVLDSNNIKFYLNKKQGKKVIQGNNIKLQFTKEPGI